jgi:hypothetical protein
MATIRNTHMHNYVRAYARTHVRKYNMRSRISVGAELPTYVHAMPFRWLNVHAMTERAYVHTCVHQYALRRRSILPMVPRA